MAIPYFTITSTPENRFPLHPGEITARINRTTKSLEIIPFDGNVRSYPLTNTSGQVYQGLFLSSNNGLTLEVGTVDFLENASLPLEYSLNKDEKTITLRINQDGGGLGVMDLRDAGLRTGPRYKFHIVPIILTIDGNYLRVITLDPETETTLDPWFIPEFTQP